VDLLSSPAFIALLTFFLGTAVGIYIHRSKYSDATQADRLKVEIQSLEKEFEDYKDCVSGHFSKTSALVNELTVNYAKVYQHLAEGSQALTNTEQMSLQLGQDEQQLVSIINNIEESVDELHNQDDMIAPKDYAPKTNCTETEGMLSEAFSINTDKHEVDVVLDPAEQKTV